MKSFAFARLFFVMLFLAENSKSEFEGFEKARIEAGILKYAYYVQFDGNHEFSKDDAPIIGILEDLNG